MGASQYSQSLLFWVQSQLNILIGADDFAPLLLSLDDDELQTYCLDLLGSDTTSLSFINELISRRNQEIREQKFNQTQKQKTKKKKQKNNNNKQTKSMKLSASDNPSLK